MNGHLTDCQMLELLLDEKQSIEVEDHLRVCPTCTHEVGQVRAAELAFNRLTENWAQAEVVRTIPFPSLGTPRRWWLNNILVTAAAVLTVCVSLFWHGLRVSRDSARKQSFAMRIAADDKFLEQMDKDLRYGNDVITFPTSELRIRATHITRPKRSGR